jgi:hypothetical protein
VFFGEDDYERYRDLLAGQCLLIVDLTNSSCRRRTTAGLRIPAVQFVKLSAMALPIGYQVVDFDY